MTVLEKFYAISGNEVTRNEVENLISEAKQANEVEVIYRLSKVLLEHPNTDFFIVDIKQYPTALNAPRHKGIYKEALNDCGRLRKGWKFEKGSVVKVAQLKRKTKAKLPTTKKNVAKKPIAKPNLKKFNPKKGKKVQEDFRKWFKRYYGVDLGAVLNFDLKPKRNYFNITPSKLKRVDLQNLERFAHKNNATFKIELEENGVDRLAIIVTQIQPLKTFKTEQVKGLGNPTFSTLKEAKKYYLDWAFENLRGKKYFHKELGKWVIFNRKGIEHTLSYKISVEKIQLITQAEEMLKKSTLISFEPDKKKREEIKGIYRMASVCVVEDIEKDIVLTLREGQNGVIYYDHKIEKIEKLSKPKTKKLRTTSLGEKTPIVKCGNEAFTVKPCNKTTKTNPKPQKKGIKNKGLGTPNVNPNSLAYKLANRRNRTTEFYEINDKQLSDFLGKIEVKEKESVVITVTGGQGSMKTRFAFRCMDAFAKNYKTGHASIEEHPDSTLYWGKVHEYISEASLLNISNPEIKDTIALDKLIQENEVIIIDSFAKVQELDSRFEIDKDLRKKYDGKLFIVIFQQTADGKMRGGTKSQFDADIVLFTEKYDDYTNNYVYADKNRYQNKTLSNLQYNIYHGKLNDIKEKQLCSV